VFQLVNTLAFRIELVEQSAICCTRLRLGWIACEAAGGPPEPPGLEMDESSACALLSGIAASAIETATPMITR